MESINKSLKKLSNKNLFNDLLSSVFYVVIILYLTQMSPQLPPMIKDLFKNNIFRVVILFMILVLANISYPMALIVSIAFVVTMNNLQIEYFEESVEESEEEQEPVEEEKEEKEEKTTDKQPIQEENEQTGCFDQRPADMSKVLPVLENQKDIFGEVQFD
jgi:flagellar biosynthesis component FlhA